MTTFAFVSANSGRATTGAFDSQTILANCILLAVGHFAQAAPGDITDSPGNSGGLWTRDAVDDNDAASTLLHIENPLVSTTHTVSTAGLGSAGLCAMAFQGYNTKDQSVIANSGNTPVTSIQHGTGITPSGPNQLLVATLGIRQQGDSTAIAIDVPSGFTLAAHIDSSLGANTHGCAIAYKINPAQTNHNPVWSWTGANTAAMTLTAFGDPREIKTLQGVSNLTPSAIKTVQGLTVPGQIKMMQGLRF